MRNAYLVIITALAILGAAGIAEAATLTLVPEKKSVGIGETFYVDAILDSEGAQINAAQATVQFPVSVLIGTEIEKTGSIFNFWVEEPAISNEEGTVRFIGGTPKGVSGGALKVLRLKFRATGVGEARLSISDAVVTAADGKGTNVLSGFEGTVVAVGGAAFTPPAPAANVPISPAALPPPPPVEQPVRVVRVAAPARGLPEKPVLRVPLYPDPSRWYSHAGEITVLWEVPDDITAVAAVLNQNSNTAPSQAEAELYTGKNLGNAEESISYIHVRFKNSAGWGATVHYRIAIDRAAPLPFEIGIDSEVSDNPTPTVQFETQDALSGIKEIHLRVDQGAPIIATGTALTLLAQPPGKHTVTVQVFDFAENSVTDDLAFEILPLPTPTVQFVTKTVSQGELIFASGTSIPNSFVDLRVTERSGKEAAVATAATDNQGNWQATMGEHLAVGRYILTANARDSRSAVSYPTERATVKIKPATVLSVGALDLGWFELVLLLILMGAAGASFAAWRQSETTKTRAAYRVIAGRDVDKLTVLLENDLKELEVLEERHDASSASRAAFLVGKMRDTMAKMRKYVGQEVEKLK